MPGLCEPSVRVRAGSSGYLNFMFKIFMEELKIWPKATEIDGDERALPVAFLRRRAGQIEVGHPDSSAILEGRWEAGRGADCVPKLRRVRCT